MENHPRNPVAVLGIGNLLMKDDGVGIRVLERLQTNPPPGADLYDVGTSILRMQSVLEEYPTVIVLDAVACGSPPGTVVRIDGHSLEASGSGSLHDMGVAEVLWMIPKDKRPRLTILGVQPAEVEIGLELSECAAKAVDLLERAVRSLLCESVQMSAKQSRY